MKIFITILIILIIGGGGWYFYSLNSDNGETAQNNETPTPSPTPTPPPAGGSIPAPAGETHIVSITSGAFVPKTLSINVGDTVKFVNNDTKDHWPASGPHPQHTTCAGFDSIEGIKPGASYSHTFTEAKTCPMHDHLNPTIFGSITVKAAVSTPPPPSTSSSVKEVSVSAKNFEFSVKEIKVKKGEKVKINFSSTGGTHDWRVDEFNAKTSVINNGQTSSAEFTADKTGTFEYYCSVGTHRQMGMVGKLIVE